MGTVKALIGPYGSAECSLLPCPGWDAEALFPSATLRVEGIWLAGEPSAAPALLIAHLLAGGPCFFLRPQTSDPAQLPRAWTDLHAQLANENRAGVLKAAGRHAPEVMLVPLQGREGPAGPSLPIFAAFVAPLLGGDFVRQLLLSMRLPLVFDLDETLLVAKSQSQLSKELKALRDVRRPTLLAADDDPQQGAKLQALDREEQLMRDDLELLRQFAESDTVVYRGQRLAASMEQALTDDGRSITRPVIRLPGNEDTLLTRIEPGRPESSMVFKLRPNWRAIWSFLGGLLDPSTGMAIATEPPSPKLRFDAYVCTAAERGYALEAWRVLDPDGWMIPMDQRNKRVTSGSKVKSLSTVLGLGRAPPPGPGGRTASHMPLAVIVDDRVEVWDESSRGQVLQVEPFRPWEEQAAQDCGLSGTPTMQSLMAQMVRLQGELFNLRMHAFHRIQEVLRKQLEMVKSQPINLQQAHQHYGTLLLQPPWVEALLQAGLQRQSNPEPLPAALQAVMERPVDPRLLRRQQQQQQGAAQQGVAQQPPQQAQQQQGAPAAVLPQLAGPEGAALFAALQGVLNAPVPAPDPRQLPMQPHMQPQQPMQQYAPGMQQQQGGMAPPSDPRLLARQQQQQQQQQQQAMQAMGPPQEAAGPQRPHRQRPGRLAGQPTAPPQQGPGVAALQQQMAADPRRRPQPAGPGGAAANSNTLFDVFDMLPAVGPPQQQQQQQQQPGPMMRQQHPGGRGPQPMRRLAGLHPPPAAGGPPQQQPAAALPPHMQQQQQQQQVGRQGTPPMQAGAPAPQPPAGGLTQQQLAWGTVSAPVQAAPMLPHMQQPAPVAPGAGPPPRPMQRAAPPAVAAAQQQMGDEEMNQRWMNALMPGGQADGPRPMQRAGGDAGAQQAQQGAKRKSSEDAEGNAARQKQSRYEPVGGPAAAAQNRHALGQLIELTQRQKMRLQWQHSQRPDGSWHSAAFVGSWLSDYPPPGTAPAASATGPTQQIAMEAAAAAALAQLASAGGGRQRGGPAQQRPYMPPAGPPPQRQPVGGGGAAVNSRNALEVLLGHFPQATNHCDWQDQPPTSDGLPRCRLVINSGEFEAVGVGHAGPRGEKKAKQHAALQVLQRLGYNVSFDVPPAGGAGGGYAPQGGAGPGAGQGGGRRYERGRTLDARAAAAAAQQQNPASRNAYLASLQDELG